MNTGILNGLFGFVIIGALMYFMMRKGGCCGHSHGEHQQTGGHSHDKPDTGKAKGPVCGMTIEEENAVGTSEYEGETYYFCAAGCKESFEKEREKYIKAAGKQADQRRCC